MRMDRLPITCGGWSRQTGRHVRRSHPPARLPDGLPPELGRLAGPRLPGRRRQRGWRWGGAGRSCCRRRCAAAPHGGLPPHWAASAYLAHVAVEAADAPDALARLEPLGAAFPGCGWVRGAAAAAHYSARNFDEAGALFSASLASDPHRLEGLDTYSNVLYVREDGPGLSLLARAAAATDPFSPVAASIAGNYASLRGDHARAVAAFKRALALEPGAASAWTLAGHEYVELKTRPPRWQPTVAPSPPPRATIAPGTAWAKRTSCCTCQPTRCTTFGGRPLSARETRACGSPSGQCAEATRSGGGTATAKRAYRRALAAGDAEGVALRRLARLCEADGDDDDAAACHAAALAAADRAAAEGGGDGGDGGALGPDAVDALVFLSAYHRDRGDDAAADAAEGRLLDAGGGGGVGGGGPAA